MFEVGLDLGTIEAPSAAIEYARRLAQQDKPMSALLQAYQLGQENFQQRMIEQVVAITSRRNSPPGRARRRGLSHRTADICKAYAGTSFRAGWTAVPGGFTKASYFGSSPARLRPRTALLHRGHDGDDQRPKSNGSRCAQHYRVRNLQPELRRRRHRHWRAPAIAGAAHRSKSIQHRHPGSMSVLGGHLARRSRGRTTCAEPAPLTRRYGNVEHEA